MDFTKFDKEVDVKQLQKDVEEAKKNGGTGEYEEVPEGKYTCKVEKMELGTAKDGRPMLRAMMRIKGDGNGEKCKFTKSCLFMNRVIYGTKNDAGMIASCLGWLNSLAPSEEIKLAFESYSQFADLVMDIYEDVAELEYVVHYDPDAFNSISIEDVLE